MASDLPVTGSDHPAPLRNRTNQVALWCAILAAPLAWALHLLINYSIAGQNCIGAWNINEIAPSGRATIMLVIDGAAVLVAIIAGYVAYRSWHDTKAEKEGDTRRLVHSGEGRTRFLALCGMLTSGLFGLAVAVDALGVMVGPPC